MIFAGSSLGSQAWIARGSRSAGVTMRDFESVHAPVLKDEVVAAFSQVLDRDATGWIVDGTLGAGGHSALLLEHFPSIQLLGIDQDPQILAIAHERLDRFHDRVQLHHARASELGRLLRKQRFEKPLGMLFDVGVSSLQIDRPERGFSFAADGPLDMRMDPTRERTAADIINEWDEVDLADLFYYEGDERRARDVARAIVASRRRAAFQRTGALADLVARVVGGGGRIHPATRVFQALRRAVNEEGEELQAALETAHMWLANGGVLCAISFHSGEDRVVKRFLQDGASAGDWQLLTKKPIGPSHTERRSNARARSAKLRAAVRVRSEEQAHFLGEVDATEFTRSERPEARGEQGGDA